MCTLEGSASVPEHVESNVGLGEAGCSATGHSQRDGRVAARIPTLPVTGERFVPGMVGERLFRQHEVRYVFAGALAKNKRVLDVASGSGVGTRYLSSAGAASCIGLDIDKLAVQYARAAYDDCVFIQCEATRLCLAEASVDAVVSFETVEHIEDQKAFLLECRRVLTPGGIFVCSTPNRTLARWGEDNPFHCRELTVEEFNDLISSVFTDVQLYAQNTSNYPLYVARTLLARLLKRIRLMESISQLLRGKSSFASQTTEFGRDFIDLKEIEPLKAALLRLRQPLFVIAVGRKAPASLPTESLPLDSVSRLP
jgi:ubiquinone/menaquinone biosynthesis C-methylase UbiE